jgi:hypothetical protein
LGTAHRASTQARQVFLTSSTNVSNHFLNLFLLHSDGAGQIMRTVVKPSAHGDRP